MIRRRGIGLLLVLAVLVVASAATAIAMRAGTTAMLAAGREEDDAAARLLMMDAITAIELWLRDKADQAVLPPDVDTPTLPIMHESVQNAEGTPASLAITAIDLRGTAPLMLANDADRASLPVRYRDALTEIDELADQDNRTGTPIDIAALSAAARIYPTSVQPTGTTPPLLGSTSTAIGSLVAFDGAIAQARVEGRLAWVLNINTAPMDLLHAVASGGSTPLDAVDVNRTEGEHSDLTFTIDEPGRPLLRLVGESDAWAFRADVRVGRVQRSVWLEYRRSAEPYASDGWEVIRRVVITR